MECKFRVLLLSCGTLENTKPSVNSVMKNRLLKSLFVVIYYGNRELLPVPNKKILKVNQRKCFPLCSDHTGP